MQETKLVQSSSSGGQLDLEFFDWLRIIWQRRYRVLLVILMSVLLAILYLHLATYRYTAKLDVTPVESSGGSSLASQLGGLSGLASLAGFSLPGGTGNGSFDLYVESIKSRAVADELAEHADLMHYLFAREWDARTGSWHPPSGILPALKRGLLKLLGARGFGWQAPDGGRLKEYLDTRLIVAQNTKKKVVNILFTDRDPKFAVHFLSVLHATVDNRVRQRTLSRTNENIAYLEHKLQTVTNVEHQRAIAQALSEQEKLRMMANTTASYAAEPFGEPRASDTPTEPKPLSVLVIAILAGAMLGSGLVLLPALRAARRQT